MPPLGEGAFGERHRVGAQSDVRLPIAPVFQSDIVHPDQADVLFSDMEGRTATVDGPDAGSLTAPCCDTASRPVRFAVPPVPFHPSPSLDVRCHFGCQRLYTRPSLGCARVTVAALDPFGGRQPRRLEPET